MSLNADETAELLFRLKDVSSRVFVATDKIENLSKSTPTTFVKNGRI